MKIMLVDEPTANLDETNKLRVLKLLAEYVMNSNSTVLLVTHDVLSITPNSRIIQIENHKIVKDSIASEDYCAKLKESYLNKKTTKTFK